MVVYPGSFDPVTLGHLDILERALPASSTIVVVLVAEHGKAGFAGGIRAACRLFPASVAHLPAMWRLTVFDGLLVDEVKRRVAWPAVVAASATARATTSTNGPWPGSTPLLDADVRVSIYFLARPDLAAVSSTLVRDVIRHGGPPGASGASAPVAKALPEPME